MIIEECYKKSIELLLKNSTRFGVLASSRSKKAVEQNYLSIFGRDASICSLGMVASGNKKLINSARRSLLALAKYQAENGQIPDYVKPELKLADFWYFDCIDSTLWWLLAIKFYDGNVKADEKLEKKLKSRINKALSWLMAREHQKYFLLMQLEAGDWADIMPRSGFVLYTNSLWYWIKRLYNIKDAEITRCAFLNIFHLDKHYNNRYFARADFNRFRKYLLKRKLSYDGFLSFVTRSYWGEELDVMGNIMACLSGVIKQTEKRKIINNMIKKNINKPWPVKTVYEPIKKNDKLWRKYMEEYATNYPNLYHNGGIWPFIGGFWILALIKTENKKTAWVELEKLAEVNKINNWQFNEWFHGKSGKPMGMPGQSWNAGTFLLAYHYLKGDIKLNNL